MDRGSCAYYYYSFAPPSGPLTAYEADPVALTEKAGPDRNSRVEFDAHAEVEVKGWCG